MNGEVYNEREALIEARSMSEWGRVRTAGGLICPH